MRATACPVRCNLQRRQGSNRGARTVVGWFAQAIEAGPGDRYHPPISLLMGRGASSLGYQAGLDADTWDANAESIADSKAIAGFSQLRMKYSLVLRQ